MKEVVVTHLGERFLGGLFGVIPTQPIGSSRSVRTNCAQDSVRCCGQERPRGFQSAASQARVGVAESILVVS